MGKKRKMSSRFPFFLPRDFVFWNAHLIVYDKALYSAAPRLGPNTIKIRALQQKAFAQPVTDCTRRKWSRSRSGEKDGCVAAVEG